jgi:protocatechuate 3,4-dioxygenase beta subunit
MITDHDDFGGLQRDLPLLLQRRHVLKLLAGGSLLALVSCGSDSKQSSATSAATTAATASAASSSLAECAPINEETAGPYPGDGSNGPDVLTESGVVRRDITSSFGPSTTVAEGVPTSVTLTIQDTANGCVALANAAVYVWHCSRDGLYSMYSQGATNENYLRGVQQAGVDGRVTFDTIFPGAYSGRWPHIHFEVYASADDATGGGKPIATSQLAMPEDVCKLVYATAGYESSVSNFARTPLARDMVFSDDNAIHQIPTASGSVADGYTLELTVPV